MQSGIGEFLRKERESRGVELSEVAAGTRIRGGFLRAIEAEEWDRLPGDAYARAFVRTYASYLGVDPDPYMDEPERELPVAPSARSSRRARSRTLPLVLATCLIIAAAIAVAVALSGGGDEGGARPAPQGGEKGASRTAQDGGPASERASKATLALSLTATAELWVCLLDEDGKPLVDGVVLPEGAEEGPFRSGSFTVSFGNGEVEMLIDGRGTDVPESASPLGYAIGQGGRLSPLDEAERPTCT